jgi:uncharacterized damage-inducible protein DinB
MQLTITELLDYTEEERGKWAAWFAAHGDAPLRLALAGELCPTVGALVRHIFSPALHYTEFMQGATALTDLSHVPADNAAALFAFGQQAHARLRAFCARAQPADWARTHEPREGVQVTARKIVLHVLFHELRHWAQVAAALRQHGLAPPGDHDLLFSQSLA